MKRMTTGISLLPAIDLYVTWDINAECDEPEKTVDKCLLCFYLHYFFCATTYRGRICNFLLTYARNKEMLRGLIGRYFSIFAIYIKCLRGTSANEDRDYKRYDFL